MYLIRIFIFSSVLFSVLSQSALAAGDCDSNGTVSISEVQSAINMFLGQKPLAACVDEDSSGGVSIADVQRVINTFLGLTPVYSVPVIDSQPVSLTVPSSQSAQLTVNAHGTAPLKFQWYKNGVAIDNATSATYQIQSVKLADNLSQYYVKISNAQGSVISSTVTLKVTGIKVETSSYLNAKKPNIGPQVIPGGTYNNVAHAFADFFQTGEYSLFVATIEYDVTNPATYSTYGHFRFYKNINGEWIDNTPQLLTDNIGCLMPRKAIVADFNGDGKPDIFVACTGIDIVNPPGEKSKYLLSQPNGTYSVSTLPFVGFTHSASAAELNVKGFADVVVSSVTNQDPPYPYFLINNGDGTFVKDLNRSPNTEFTYKYSNTVELIDFNNSGKFDLFVAGNEPGSTPDCPHCELVTSIYPNDGKNKFVATTPVRLPGDRVLNGPLDIVYQNGAIYLLRTKSSWESPDFYNATAIQEIQYPSLTARMIYTHTGPYTADLLPWVEWLVSFNGNLVADDAIFPVSVTPPNTAPVISSQPYNLTVSNSRSARFSVNANGTAPLNYQWYRNGVAIANATANAYQIQSVSLSDNQSQYSVKISNMSGTVISSTATLTVTPAIPAGLKVEASSYLNAKMPNIGPQTMPIYNNLAHAFADFFQEGNYSLFVATVEYDASNPATYNTYGQFKFYKKVSGKWVDSTSQLLVDTSGCLNPRKAIVADFNGDGKPDVFVACRGIDAAPYAGEKSKYLLSQSNGTYSVMTLPFIGNIDSASAAELHAQGFADIVITSNGDQDPPYPYFLINNRDGTFTKDMSRSPNAELRMKPINVLELIDFTGSGSYDLFAAGNDPDSIPACKFCELGTAIFPNDGQNRFVTTTPVRLPGDTVFTAPSDIVFQNGAIYLLRSQFSWKSPGFDDGTAIQKILYPSLVASMIYTHRGTYADYPYVPPWVTWLVPYNGNLVADDAIFPVSVAP